jgi:hypothetical protein
MPHHGVSGNASAAIGSLPLQSRRVFSGRFLTFVSGTQNAMNFVLHDLGDVVADDGLRDTVECDCCNVPAELLAAFFYCPHGVDAPLGDEQLLPVIVIMCPVCGPQFQLRDLGCAVGPDRV